MHVDEDRIEEWNTLKSVYAEDPTFLIAERFANAVEDKVEFDSGLSNEELDKAIRRSWDEVIPLLNEVTILGLGNSLAILGSYWFHAERFFSRLSPIEVKLYLEVVNVIIQNQQAAAQDLSVPEKQLDNSWA